MYAYYMYYMYYMYYLYCLHSMYTCVCILEQWKMTTLNIYIYVFLI